MELCMNCPYVDYLKFRDYYGSGDYADQWVRAALEGKRTAFLNGNADFRPYGEDGKYGEYTWYMIRLASASTLLFLITLYRRQRQ